MRIKLIFDHWNGRYDSESGEFVQAPEDLYHTNFHSGSTYWGEIQLTAGDYLDLREAAQEGCFPVFVVMEVK